MKRLLTALMIFAALPAAAQQASSGSGGTLRVLDKITGRTQDLEFSTGQSRSVGLLSITMSECRFPTGNPLRLTRWITRVMMFGRYAAAMNRGRARRLAC